MHLVGFYYKKIHDARSYESQSVECARRLKVNITTDYSWISPEHVKTTGVGVRVMFVC